MLEPLVPILRIILRVLYGFRVDGASVLSTNGPVLLVPNHVSWLDWLLLGVLLDRDWKFVVSEQVANSTWLHRRIMINERSFPVDINSPYVVRRMTEHLQSNGKLVLFAEGRISSSGHLMKLFEGTGFLLFKTRAKLITCHLRGANRLPFVKHKGWTQWFPRVSVHFSKALTAPHPVGVSTVEARSIITDWLRDRMVEQQFEVEMREGEPTVLETMMANARRRPGDVALQDVTMKKLSNRRLIVGAHVLGTAFERRLDPCASHVGVLLPNVNATPVSIVALWMLGKVPAMLNFSSGPAIMKACAGLAELKQIITSRAFVEKAKLDLSPLEDAGIELLFLEDVATGISGGDKLGGLLRVIFRPRSILRVMPKACLPALILFTSGSEGVPKGVVLSHRNILANIRQMLSVIDVEDDDRMFNALPLFHCFGLTIGTFLPLVRGIFTFLYPSPLHYRVVPTAFYNLDCTILMGTNTFLNGYARKAHPYDFRSLRFLFAGAEKTQEATYRTWAQKYGVRILEGYGATECSPCLSVNTRVTPKTGSAGKLLPGIDWRIDDVEGVDDGGRLHVTGPNVMSGYLNEDANDAFKKLDGWYDTGDIASVDDRGFVHILGRMKRFAKVSGEMVSLTAVEDALAGAFPQYGLRCSIAVVTRHDERKGEALIAVTNEPKLTVDEIRAVLLEKGLNTLSVPREVVAVREIPKLGTGKIDYRTLNATLKL